MSEPQDPSDDTDAKLGESSSMVWLAPHARLAAILLGLAAPIEGEGDGHAKLRQTVAQEVVLRWLGPDGLLEAQRISLGIEPLNPFVHHSALDVAVALGQLRDNDHAAFSELMERLSTIPAPPATPPELD